MQIRGPIWSSPLIDNKNTVYIGSGDGRLYAIACGSSKILESEWPIFRGGQQRNGRLLNEFFNQSKAEIAISHSKAQGFSLNLLLSPIMDKVLEYSTDLKNWKQQQRFSRTSASSPVILPVTNNYSSPLMFWRLRAE